MHALPTTLGAFFWHFLRGHKWLLSGIFASGFIWGVYSIIGPYLIKMLIDSVTEYKGPLENIWSAVWFPVTLFISLEFIIGFIFRATEWLNYKLFPKLRVEIKTQMYGYVMRHSYSYFQNNFSGSIVSKMSDMENGIIFLLTTADESLWQFVQLVFAIGLLFTVHPAFAVVMFTWSVVFVFVNYRVMSTTEKLSDEVAEKRARTSGLFVDTFSNFLNLHLFARVQHEKRRLTIACEDAGNAERALRWFMIKLRMILDLSVNLLSMGMLLSLVYLYAHQKVTLGDFAFIMMVTSTIYQNIFYINTRFSQVSEELGKCAQALTLIKTPHAVTDAADAKVLKVTKGEIVFDKVSFGYHPNRTFFNNQNLVIQPKEKVGLVGFSGGGKSTLVHLMLRFFDVQSGQIRIDGQNIAHVTQDSLHENIAMIPQDTALFHRSLMENIRYGRLDATDEEVIEASKKAHCHDFIMRMPDNYHTLVGERGNRLSGGQRQRIAIARCFLKNAPIVILDEATSALDSITEKYIQESLNILAAGKTTLVIAHRLSTLSEMDRILVFQRGQIIEQGTHAQLLEHNGAYKKLWQMQSGGLLPEKENSAEKDI